MKTIELRRSRGKFHIYDYKGWSVCGKRVEAGIVKSFDSAKDLHNFFCEKGKCKKCRAKAEKILAYYEENTNDRSV